ncbi:hypothetical protein DPMN_096427 [Dreissena polymorpha]|uniref:Uncharacterized protein n=1 Tax=Dreissena polymorpha TaxID=45954 RepID=A0A9D4R4Q9_DREPO|nr:hypothetical protein DPMN_096427 [Dreissena polymorpha]
MVSENIDASDDNDSDNEDDQIDGRSLSEDANHVHNVTSAGVHEQGECDPDRLAVEHFMKGCGCGRHCQKIFTPCSVYQSILDMREKSKDKKEMFLMGILSNCLDTSSSTKRGKKRSRVHTHFAINGASVCRELFSCFFYVKRAVLYTLIQTVNQGGCTPRTQGNRGRNPKHALMFDDVNRVVQFIMNTSEEIGLPYPAAPGEKTILQSSSFHQAQQSCIYMRNKALLVKREMCGARTYRHSKASGCTAFRTLNCKTKRGRLRHLRATSKGHRRRCDRRREATCTDSNGDAHHGRSQGCYL